MSSVATDYDVSVGPVRGDDVLCRHAECIVLPTDPAPRFLSTCGHGGVFYVPRPDTDAPVGFCEWHLARYLDAFPQQAAKLRAEWNADHYAAHPAVTALEDKQVPRYYEACGRRWRRLLLDQVGLVHYVPVDDGEPALLALEADVETYHSTALGTIDGFFDELNRIRSQRGWAQLDETVLEPMVDAAGGAGGGA